MSVLDVIKKEHRAAEALLNEAEKLDAGDDRIGELAKAIEQALTTHVAIEERLFYSRLRDRAEAEKKRIDVFEAYTEHEVARHLIELLKSQRKHDAKFKAELQVLAESIRHHVREEESTIFSLARELLSSDELDDLGKKWEKAKQQAESRTPARRTPPATARAGTGAKKKPARPKARSTSVKRPARKKG
jgi:hemerythrin-like domain-containing protein